MEDGMTRDWGTADPSGIRTAYASPARLVRWRRSDGPCSVATLLGGHRALVVAWLKGKGTKLSSRTLFAKAGNARVIALDAAEYLVQNGWVELKETRPRADWNIATLTWLDADGLRAALGLPTHATLHATRTSALSFQPGDKRLVILHQSLSSLGTATLGRRARIVAGLDAWCSAERTGTRNTFALTALNDTHGMTTADWQWIERFVDPESLGISKHTPALWMRGPVRLHFGTGMLDLGVIHDLIALSPATLQAVKRMEGPARGWLVVENRTSFESVARSMGDRYIVLWMPGFVAEWWLDTVRHLSGLFPLPVRIAADPDPAGVEIALRAGTAWSGEWIPWAMSAEALDAAGTGKPLNAYDRERLVALESVAMPASLRELCHALSAGGIKGEQEAIALADWIGSSR